MEEQRVLQDISDLFNKTNRLDKELVEVKVDQKHYTEALEKVADSNMRLVETLQSMELTFAKMDGKINEISKDILDTKQQVGGIDCRMKKIEDDNNFEIMGFFKKNFPWIAALIGLAIYSLSDFIKF